MPGKESRLRPEDDEEPYVFDKQTKQQKLDQIIPIHLYPNGEPQILDKPTKLEKRLLNENPD